MSVVEGHPRVRKDRFDYSITRHQTLQNTGADAWFKLSNEELLPDSMKGCAEEFHRMNDTLDVWFDLLYSS